ncbi:MAG: stage IV sporulation protein A, partial [Gemmiger sp.]
MTQEQIYQNIAQRTGGDIYIGVVGPVRSGKSTFIKRFSELMLLPHIKNDAQRARANDELPQSAGGRTIMTTEPKFVPEKAVNIDLPDGGSFRARLIDCVGFLVDGALGSEENNAPRLVKSPWFDEAVPFDVAAEMGTSKVINEHATVGLVITTDGSVADLPRKNYEAAERRTIRELEKIGKPYVILLNCTDPSSEESKALAASLSETYHHTVCAVNCLEMTAEQIGGILQKLLYEFPIREIAITMPSWVTLLEPGHWLQSEVYRAIAEFGGDVRKMGDLTGQKPHIECEYLSGTTLTGMNLATGSARLRVGVPSEIFYRVLSEQTGLDIADEASLMPCVVSLAKAKRAYDKIKNALDQVEATGYGIVMPDIEELKMEEPQIVQQNGQYGVRLCASAPSLHMMKAIIRTELSPTVGSEQQGEALIRSILQDFESDPGKIWNTDIFGKSLSELVNEGLQAKLMHMPQDARTRLQQTLER